MLFIRNFFIKTLTVLLAVIIGYFVVGKPIEIINKGDYEFVYSFKVDDLNIDYNYDYDVYIVTYEVLPIHNFDFYKLDIFYDRGYLFDTYEFYNNTTIFISSLFNGFILVDSILDISLIGSFNNSFVFYLEFTDISLLSGVNIDFYLYGGYNA